MNRCWSRLVRSGPDPGILRFLQSPVLIITIATSDTSVLPLSGWALLLAYASGLLPIVIIMLG